jgi:hypothetical protein
MIHETLNFALFKGAELHPLGPWHIRRGPASEEKYSMYVFLACLVTGMGEGVWVLTAS